jgi:hypothetical protein
MFRREEEHTTDVFRLYQKLNRGQAFQVTMELRFSKRILLSSSNTASITGVRVDDDN